MCWRSIPARTIRSGRSCVWTKHQSNSSPKPVRRYPFSRGDPHGMTTNTSATARPALLFAPLEGWRDVKVTERRTTIDYAKVLKDLSDIHFPKAEKIVLVQDNLNTHIPASLYETFTAAEARRLVERFEWHYTPKHGSWLNMAESELAILSSQCLDRRIPDRHNLQRQVAAWLLHRNTHNVKADWRFTATDARIKLKSLYPAL